MTVEVNLPSQSPQRTLTRILSTPSHGNYVLCTPINVNSMRVETTLRKLKAQ